ncbi:MAG: hypothetical protein GKR94_20320 [Gammaproteobacteria bacterium]|nr:hypothetical protein [Gammaproteobacteria bacterium]
MWERHCEIGIFLTASRLILSKGDTLVHARKVLLSRLPLVNEGLEGKEWLAGGFSSAYIVLFIGPETAHDKRYEAGFSLDPAWKNRERWYEAMKARPSTVT